MRSRLPSQEGLTPAMIRFFEDLDRRVAAQTDLSDTATTTEITTAFNSLLAAMRDAGKMEKS